MRYDKYMDEECILLCDALNSVPGIRTYESCCGHGKGDFRIWFYLEDRIKINYLKVISTACDPRYSGIVGWVCILENSDMVEHLPVFKISSNGVIGKRAYKESEVVAENISGLLRHKNFMEAFIKEC